MRKGIKPSGWQIKLFVVGFYLSLATATVPAAVINVAGSAALAPNVGVTSFAVIPGQQAK